MKPLLLVILLSAIPVSAAEPTAVASKAINAFGTQLLRECGEPDANALLSPYSIQNAFAMAYAGADGETRTEMARVLHYPPDDSALGRSLAALRSALEQTAQKSAAAVAKEKTLDSHFDPITLTMANRLFGQTGYGFRDSFLARLREEYAAPFEALDFRRDSEGARRHINEWVEDQTQQRIRNLIPGGALDALTRLVLANAIYLKAPWAEEFDASATRPQIFYLGDANPIRVPMMSAKRMLGYAKRDGYTALTVPYRGGDLQFLIVLPDQAEGLADLEQRLTADLFSACAQLPSREVELYVPKFRIEPPALELSGELESLGMKRAFNIPPGSANFDRMAKRQTDDSLHISEVFHKTFLSLDEEGTEAAAATTIAVEVISMELAKDEPIQVRVDHPFVFAIQHCASGACLFLGHVADPR